MWKKTSRTVYVYAAVFFLIVIVLPLIGYWSPHPLKQAFYMMEERRFKEIQLETEYTPDPQRPYAEIPVEAAISGVQTEELTWNASPESLPPAHSPSPSVYAESPAPASTPVPAGLNAVQPLAPSPSPPIVPVQDAVYRPGGKLQPIPVLNYHSVAVDPGNVVVIQPDKFREQMQFLYDSGYKPLTMAEFTDIFEGKTEAPAKPVLLTFDDGYADNFETAMPILQEFGFPATLFMSPGMTGTPGYIDWRQAKELHRNGWDIEPHGMTHPSLPKLTAEQQAYEITEARRLIEVKLGVTADIFCYPYGHYNRDTLDILSANGFRYAFTIEQGKSSSGQHPYKLKRIFVNGEEKLAAFKKRLAQ